MMSASGSGPGPSKSANGGPGGTSGVLGKRKVTNKLVSSSLLSRSERELMTDLVVKFKAPSFHGNSKSQCWKYVGHLHSISKNQLLNENKYYCSPCLVSEQADVSKGHLSNVSCWSTTTSTGTMAVHLSTKHGIYDVLNSTEKMGKINDYLKKYDFSNDSAGIPSSRHEISRDIALWFCRDLIPFEAVSKEGMIDFFKKICPNVILPSPTTLSCSGLIDIYQAVHAEVRDKLADVRSLCLMFDGWTDRHKARPYLGIRASFIKDWSYHVVTLGCHVVPVHTGRGICDHVLRVLSEFVPDVKQVLLSSCHDGAANMIKASQLLKVENYQHCTAHALHLLLTVDSVNLEDSIVTLLQKCRDIVSSLHFKSTLLLDEFAENEDKSFVDALTRHMTQVSDLLDINDQCPLIDETEIQAEHHHRSLKLSCPTRWNSSLRMIESILDLKREVMNCLKRIGKVDLCLDTDELDLLSELRTFLKPFEGLTELVGLTMPTLSMIPLIKLQIRKLCAPVIGEHSVMKSVKEKVLNRLPARLPESQAVHVLQLLDPSTKDLMARDVAVNLLKDTIHNLSQKGFIKFQTTTTPTAGESSPVSKRRQLKLEMLNELRRLAPSNSDHVDDVALEVTNYLTCRQVAADEDDVLGFWKKNSNVYPVLAEVATLYFAMSASSVPVESMFSTVGLICNSKRCMIGDDKVHRVSFVHDNFKLVFP